MSTTRCATDTNTILLHTLLTDTFYHIRLFLEHNIPLSLSLISTDACSMHSLVPSWQQILKQLQSVFCGRFFCVTLTFHLSLCVSLSFLLAHTTVFCTATSTGFLSPEHHKLGDDVYTSVCQELLEKHTSESDGPGDSGESHSHSHSHSLTREFLEQEPTNRHLVLENGLETTYGSIVSAFGD
jgi:hypothetical protein